MLFVVPTLLRIFGILRQYIIMCIFKSAAKVLHFFHTVMVLVGPFASVPHDVPAKRNKVHKKIKCGLNQIKGLQLGGSSVVRNESYSNRAVMVQ